MSSLVVYALAKCSTCRAASQWLKARKISHVEKPIRESAPSVAELRVMLAAQQGAIRRLFNTSGLEYRALGLAQKLSAMNERDALQLLAGNGMLVKRPFVIGPGVALVGFKEAAWVEAFRGR